MQWAHREGALASFALREQLCSFQWPRREGALFSYRLWEQRYGFQWAKQGEEPFTVLWLVPVWSKPNNGSAVWSWLSLLGSIDRWTVTTCATTDRYFQSGRVQTSNLRGSREEDGGRRNELLSS